MAHAAERRLVQGAGGLAMAVVSTTLLGAPPQDMLQTAGTQAAHILDLWRVMLAVCTAVFVAVLVVFGWALWRAPRAAPGTPADVARSKAPEPAPQRSVVSAAVASTLLLFFLIVASVLTDRALARLSLKDAVHVQVTANQWWWELRYEGAQASDTVMAANELHVPVGRPVVVSLKANDVIHSFWVPHLHGKKDLIPGRSSQIQFQADRPGTYRGQCAEFCGLQHALMAFEVVAEPPAQFDAWLARQRAPAHEPADVRQQRGRELFMSSTCAMCHAIQGTDASAQRAPDLTHLASRSRIAAGTLPNDEATLKRWIRNPQQFKPGNYMPASNLSDDELDALVAYLRSLT